jgi:hypothetical protein
MIEAMLEAIFTEAQAKPNKAGERELSEGRRLTLYASHNGVGLTVTKVEALKIQGDTVIARNDKGERFFIALQDLFAAAVEGTGASASGRRAGFM